MDQFELCGFLFTADEWNGLDDSEQWELLAVGTEPEARGHNKAVLAQCALDESSGTGALSRSN